MYRMERIDNHQRPPIASRVERASTMLIEPNVTIVDAPERSRQSSEVPLAELAELVPVPANEFNRSPVRPPWPWRIIRGIGQGLEWLFGVASLLVGLGILSSLPILQVLSLGYLLEASGRVSRSGRLRDGIFGVRMAARLGAMVTGTWLVLLPLRFVWQMWFAASLIDPRSTVTAGWRIGLLVLALVTLFHLLTAWYAGGRWRHFFWPIWAPVVLGYQGCRWLLASVIHLPRVGDALEREQPRLYRWLSDYPRPSRHFPPVRAWRALREGRLVHESCDAVWTLFQRLRLASYFWLGLRGFVGALLWLALPSLLLIAVTRGQPLRDQDEARMMATSARSQTRSISPAAQTRWTTEQRTPQLPLHTNLADLAAARPERTTIAAIVATTGSTDSSLTDEAASARATSAADSPTAKQQATTAQNTTESPEAARPKKRRSDQAPVWRVLAGLLGSILLAGVLVYLPFMQAHFAAERRFWAFFEVGRVRALFQRAPLACWLALLVTLSFALPLYLLKIEFLPRELLWLPSLIFVAFGWPARLVMGWAMSRARRRAEPRFFLFRWFASLAELPVIAIYVFFVYITQYVLWNGAWSLFEQHAFLLPAPFLSL